MAQQTELQVYALPGGLHSFVAKTAAAAVMPGLEFVAPENRHHYVALVNRFNLSAPENRLHLSAPEE